VRPLDYRARPRFAKTAGPPDALALRAPAVKGEAQGLRFFFFGLLSDPDILELVISRPPPGQPFSAARLMDRRLYRVENETFPMLTEAPGEAVPGVIVEGLTDNDLARIEFFESLEYEHRVIEVDLLAGPRIQARAFAATAHAAPATEIWTVEDWRRRHKAKDLREAAIWMSLYGILSIEEADRLWDAALKSGRSPEDAVREFLAGPHRLRS